MPSVRAERLFAVLQCNALRHTFLTEASRETQNVRALMRIAGHSRLSTTMKYVHPEQRDVIAISAKVQQARQQRDQERAEKERMIQADPAPVAPVFSPVVQ